VSLRAAWVDVVRDVLPSITTNEQETTMYASEREVYGMYFLADVREMSRKAGKRFAELRAAAGRRRERMSGKRRARHARQSAAVTASA
jgi:hypothetical protein